MERSFDGQIEELSGISVVIFNNCEGCRVPTNLALAPKHKFKHSIRQIKSPVTSTCCLQMKAPVSLNAYFGEIRLAFMPDLSVPSNGREAHLTRFLFTPNLGEPEVRSEIPRSAARIAFNIPSKIDETSPMFYIYIIQVSCIYQELLVYNQECK